MRTMMNRFSGFSLLAFGAFALGGGACEPVSPISGQFWSDHGDASFVLGGTTGSGGLVDPTGTGGITDPLGTGGDTGSTGTAGTGDDSGTAGTGAVGTAGTFGSGGDGGSAGEGGATGTGGVGGRSGSGGSSGTTGRGGTTGSAGATGTAGRGGTTGTAGRGGTTGAGGTAGAAGNSGGVLTGTVMISVTTKAPGGRYQPDNVGAIWIADSGTRFVKSLYVWGTQRRNELRQWTSATSAAGLANNLVDAVTAATMRSHGQRTASWNGTDTKKALVPDGAYKVCFEVEDGAQQYQCVDFTKSRTAQTVMPADTAGFTMRKIAYTP